MDNQRIIGVALVVIAAVFVGGVIMGPVSTYQEVQSHETTQAEIVQSGMESATEEDDGETEVEYYPRIEYEYAVDGTTYADTQVFHPTQVGNESGELRGKEFDSRGDAQDVVDRYESGTSTTAYYDPDDPSVSYLEDPSNDLLMTAGMMGAFGLILGGIGIGGLRGNIELNED